MDNLFAAVQPLVWTREVYQDLYGEDDEEELNLLQAEDLELARSIGEVLRDLFMVDDYDPAEPRSQGGPEDEVGTVEDFRELRAIAARTAGHTVDDYHEGRVPPGEPFQHLINHSDSDGLYLPVDFFQPFWVEEEVSVGSAVALLKDLEALRPSLQEAYPVEYSLAEAGADLDPIGGGPVRVWQVLRRLCRAAIDLNLPLHLG